MPQFPHRRGTIFVKPQNKSSDTAQKEASLVQATDSLASPGHPLEGARTSLPTLTCGTGLVTMWENRPGTPSGTSAKAHCPELGSLPLTHGSGPWTDPLYSGSMRLSLEPGTKALLWLHFKFLSKTVTMKTSYRQGAHKMIKALCLENCKLKLSLSPPKSP